MSNREQYLPVLISPHTLHKRLGTPIADSSVVCCCCILCIGIDEGQIERRFT
jgi:hypothetical protein